MGQTQTIGAKSLVNLMQRSCPTIECCHANQIHFHFDVKPLNICTVQLNVNDLKKETWKRNMNLPIKEAAMKLGYLGLRENQKKKSCIASMHFLEGKCICITAYTNNMLDLVLTQHYQATMHQFLVSCIVILAINCFNSGITCFEYGLCNTC